ncbi:hypothetical protein [Robiginitalea sp. SC105]|uniref:hypothetical protein n=1 Tax=Robiginitalea sp. SC105 TaxID=2762332 RepID=UPI00163B40A3|nr:hypothetical protein [Robiginitalea sp. SC105]MBC2839588.1 hypothetical protein [Robiginitalea sp. SC105]
MRFFRSVLGFYVNGSFHVSAALISLLLYTEMLSGFQVAPSYYGALFFGSVAGYNLLKYGVEHWRDRPRPGGRYRLIYAISLLSLLAGGCFLLKLGFRFWLLSAGCVLLAGLYALPVMPGFRNLRSFGLLKVPLVALIWVAATVWIPVWGPGASLGWDLWVESGQRFLWVCLLMLPFEIRDMQTDPPGMRTLPRRLGLPLTRRLSWIAAMLFVLAVGLKDAPALAEWVSKGVAAILTGLAVSGSKEDQPAYYASFWVESIPIACLLVYLGWSQFAGP